MHLNFLTLQIRRPSYLVIFNLIFYENLYFFLQIIKDYIQEKITHGITDRRSEGKNVQLFWQGEQKWKYFPSLKYVRLFQ